jgi:GT2 family glycosyltransferase
MNAAIVGPFYRSRDHVQGWCDALARQTYPHSRLYLVDDASGDGTAEALEAGLTRCGLAGRVIALTQNIGPAAARNLAIRAALDDGADLILLLDSDCRVPADWVARHVAFHQAHADVDILGGAIQGVANSAIGIADGYCSWFTAVPYSASGRVPRLHLSTTNMSLKPEVFRTIGFFDEALATGEDVAFCRKAQRSGLLLWLQSDIVATHIDRDEPAEAERHHFRWGLHSYRLSLGEHGGYYGLLKTIKTPLLVAALVPAFAVLNTGFILYRFSRRTPRVWLYLPWIFRLKWSNAVGVYRGFLDPTRCLRAR